MRTLLAVSLTLIVGCSKAPPPPEINLREVAIKEIRDIDEQLVKAYTQRDATKAASFYALDAKFMLGNAPTIKGLEIESALKTAFADTNFAIKLNPDQTDAAKSGDMGYVQGIYELTATDAKSKRPVNEKGKYVVVYAKQDAGGWKIVQDIATPDAPATAVAKGKSAAAAKAAPKGKATKKKGKK